MRTKWTTVDMPDQRDRVAVITGANAGIGYETAAVLADKGAHVVLAVRNLDKGKQAAERIVSQSPLASVAIQQARPCLAGFSACSGQRATDRVPEDRLAHQQRRRDVDAERHHR